MRNVTGRPGRAAEHAEHVCRYYVHELTGYVVTCSLETSDGHIRTDRTAKRLIENDLIYFPALKIWKHNIGAVYHFTEKIISSLSKNLRKPVLPRDRRQTTFSTSLHHETKIALKKKTLTCFDVIAHLNATLLQPYDNVKFDIRSLFNWLV